MQISGKRMCGRTLLVLTMIYGGAPVFAEQPGFAGDLPEAVTEIILSEVLFGDGERRVLDEYLRAEGYGRDQSGAKHRRTGKNKELPPGLRKKLARGGELPPGWQNKITRWEVLNDEYYARSERLPDHVLRRLPDGPAGTSLRRVEDRVVRVMDATRTILDVFYLISGND